MKLAAMIAIFGETPSVHDGICMPRRERDSAESAEAGNRETSAPADQPRVMSSLSISS